MTYSEFKIRISQIERQLAKLHSVESGKSEYKPVYVESYTVRRHTVKAHTRHIVTLRKHPTAFKKR